MTSWPSDEPEGPTRRQQLASDLVGGFFPPLAFTMVGGWVLMTAEPGLVAGGFYALWCVSTAATVAIARLGRPGARIGFILGCAALSAGAPVGLLLGGATASRGSLPTSGVGEEHYLAMVLAFASLIRFPAWLAIGAARDARPTPGESALLCGVAATGLVGTFAASIAFLEAAGGPKLPHGEGVAFVVCLAGLVACALEALCFWAGRNYGTALAATLGRAPRGDAGPG